MQNFKLKLTFKGPNKCNVAKLQGIGISTVQRLKKQFINK